MYSSSFIRVKFYPSLEIELLENEMSENNEGKDLEERKKALCTMEGRCLIVERGHDRHVSKKDCNLREGNGPHKYFL